MKTMLKQTGLALAVAAGLLASPSLQAAPQDAQLVTAQREVGAFRSIELNGPYRVTIRAQGRHALSLTGARKDLAEVETYVSGDTLVVRPVKRRGFSFSMGKQRDMVTISISTAMLASLTASDSGDVDVDQVSGERFSVTLNGPSDVRASGAVGDLHVTSNGSGDLDLHQMRAGRASLKMSGPGDVNVADISGDLVARVSGSGDLEGERLRLSSATVDLNGPGSVRLDGTSRALQANVNGSGDLSVSGLAAQQVRVRMTGPGNLDLAGSAGTLNADLSGSGELDASRLSVTNATLRSRGPGSAELATVSGTLDAEMRGSGGLQAALSGKRLLLKITGPADADITGTVDVINAQLSGSGSLNARSLVAGHADVVVSGPGTAVVNVRSKVETRTAMLDHGRMVTIDRRGAREESN